VKKKLTVIGIISATLEEALKGWEYNYILNDLLSEFEIDVKLISGNLDVFIENSLIIYSSDDRELNKDIRDYFENYKNKGIKFNLFHISNEQLNHNCDYYDYANVVIRNYYDPKINKQNVITVPLGYKSGIKNKNQNYLKFNQKKYNFCFIGQLKQDRFNVVTQISKFNKVFIHITKGWNCPTSINSTEMGEIYSSTLLVPCPMGNINFDTFRICEVLESGSIPIIKKYSGNNYFENIFGENPIPIVNDWDEIINVYNNILLNPDYEITKINEWYFEFKQKLKNIIYNKLQQM
jgi:hypothetical protein